MKEKNHLFISKYLIVLRLATVFAFLSNNSPSSIRSSYALYTFFIEKMSLNFDKISENSFKIKY